MTHFIFILRLDDVYSVFYIKQPDDPSNEMKNSHDSGANNEHRNTNTTRTNTTKIADEIFKSLCIFDKCPEWHTEHHEFNYYCVACRCNVLQMCVADFSDIATTKPDLSTVKKCAGHAF